MSEQSQQQQTPQVNPADARAFVANFVPDPEALKTMPDDAVLKYHGRVNEFHSKSVKEAVEKAQKDWKPTSFPDNWRDLYATGQDGKQDQNKLMRMTRYASPQAALDALLSAQDKIRSGEYRSTSPFPDKGTPEEQANWRKEAGIPESPDKYELRLAEGVKLDDEAKPVVDGYLKAAHAAHLPPAAVNSTVNWLLGELKAQSEDQAKTDAAFKQSSEDAMRAEWGTEYRRNETLIEGLLDTAPQGLKDALKGARDAKGLPLFHSPDMKKFLIGLSLQVNPVTTLVPGASGNIATAIDDEIGKIDAWMKAPRGSPDSNKYWKDEKVQARYRELIAARDRKKAA